MFGTRPRRSDQPQTLNVYRMNDLPPGLKIGTVGELLVQLRLLECGVQAAAPLKDSGNDLVAVKGDQFRAVQVKTCLDRRPAIRRGRLPALYHLLALVHLVRHDGRLLLDESLIYCVTREQCEARTRLDWRSLLLTNERVATLFAPAIARHNRRANRDWLGNPLLRE